MVVEGEFVVNGDAEVFSCLCGLEGGIMDFVGVVEGFCFVCDADDFALLGVEFLLFIFSQILTEYVAIEPRMFVCVCVLVCVSVCACVCVISTANTVWSILMKLSINDLEDICQ